MGGISDRKQEIDRRRKRKKKLTKLKLRAAKANVSEKAIIAAKIRNLTPGAETIIKALQLEER